VRCWAAHGQKLDADLDAGSMGGFGLPDSWAGKLALKSEPRVIGHARTVTGSFDIKAAQMSGAIAICMSRFEDPMVEFLPACASSGARRVVRAGSERLGRTLGPGWIGLD
jgi:hypothetical protein